MQLHDHDCMISNSGCVRTVAQRMGAPQGAAALSEKELLTEWRR